MAKVQGKKAVAGGARRATKAAARLKTAAKTVKKVAARAAKPVKTAKKAAKKTAVVTAKVKSKAKAVAAKAVPSKVAKGAKRAIAALPSKPAAVAPPPPKAPVAPRVPAAPVAEAKRPRARRSRPRIHSDGAPVAAWLPQGEKPRPSSFIPAPARAEAPSLIAAPPASSDRLIRPEDVTEFVTRTVPIRVDVEQGGGRVYIAVNPEDVSLRSGEGIEWDFRYFGGADVTVEELVLEFDAPSPFSQNSFRTRKPGAARPHRQLSGAVHKSTPGRVRYTIRAMNPFKTELATAQPHITIVG